MNLRDWLIIIGVVIILGILVDGYRRMRLARMDSLKMSRDMGGEIENTPLDDDFNPELPGGGARVVAPGIDSQDGLSQNLSSENVALSEESNAEPYDSAIEDSDLSPIVATRDDHEHGMDESLVPDLSDRNEQPQMENAELASSVPTAHARKSDSEEIQDTDATKQEVFVINVDCRNASGFPGAELQKLLEACGMDHGEMSIFHRHEEDDLLSPIQFSVANAVEPGYFDPDSLSQLVTPGVSFFMSLPGPKDYMKAYDYMLETAQVFARNLDGELKDENRSVLTAQTIEHHRQRVRDFERKQLAKARA